MNLQRQHGGRAPLDPRTLHSAAIRELEHGNGRRTMRVLRQARRAGIALPDAEVLVYCSRRARQRELRRSGQDKEAAAIVATPVKPDVIARSTAAGRAIYVLYAPTQESEGAGLSLQALTPSALRSQLDGWMLTPQEAAADAVIPPQLAPHEDAMRAARQAMRQAEWAAAAEALAAADRRSPLAPWRLLAGAMAARGRGAHQMAAKMATQAAALADNFVLAPVLAVLMGPGAPPPPNAPSARQRRRVDGLLHAQLHLGARARTLISQIRQPSFDAHRWQQKLRQVADEICPDNTAAAVQTLFLVLRIDVAQTQTSAMRLLEAAMRAPLPGTGRMLVDQLTLLSAPLPDLADAETVPTLARLHERFGPPEFAQLVRAQLLTHLARDAQSFAIGPQVDEDNLDDVASAAARVLPGGRLRAGLPVFIQLFQAALAADPYNVDGYHLMERACAAWGTAAARKLRLRVMARMRRALPEELYPYLALARDHLKNKDPAAAQKLLDPTAGFAGGDGEVADLQATAEAQLALAAAADAPAAALSRLAWAAGHCRGELRPYIQTCRLALQLDDGSTTPRALADTLAAMPAEGPLRMMALARCLSRRATVRRQLSTLVGRRVQQMDADATASLLAPVPAKASLLFGEDEPVVAGLLPVLRKLLLHLSPAALLVRAAPVIAGGGEAALFAELKRRRPRRGEQQPVELSFLAFFLALRATAAADKLVALVEMVMAQDAPTAARLAAAADALAPLAPLRVQKILAGLDGLRTLRREACEHAPAGAATEG